MSLKFCPGSASLWLTVVSCPQQQHLHPNFNKQLVMELRLENAEVQQHIKSQFSRVDVAV